MESPRSPKRRRIVAAFNPPDVSGEEEGDIHARASLGPNRTMSPDVAARNDDAPANEDGIREQPEPPHCGAAAPKLTKFRFKSKSSRPSRSQWEGEEDDDRHHRRLRRRHRSRSRSPSPSRGRDRDRDRMERSRERGHSRGTRHKRRDRDDRHRRRRHRRHRRSRSPTPPPPPPQPTNDPFQEPPLSPNTAFRESLFDAMADDEGAAYWESVYGQPVHIYSPTRADPATGVLERMTDDEYAAYVRQKMWEKTHAGLLEARARREKEREEVRKRAEEKERVAREMERCLRRGEERRRRRGWRQRWEGYLKRWGEWEREGGVEGIPWPEGVGDGEDREIQGEEVRAFFVNGIGLEELGEKEFAARLKEERVRWHPDKMQQRLGGKVDEKVMRDVTAIFQVVDALWNDTRKNSG
ncbi:hypothetical protein VTI74DRAFT_10986 [Chaetomium olivicolor]